MLLKLNTMRNKANAIHIVGMIYSFNTSNPFSRFPYNEIMIHKQLFNQDEQSFYVLEPQMKRFENLKLRYSNIFVDPWIFSVFFYFPEFLSKKQ